MPLFSVNPADLSSSVKTLTFMCLYVMMSINSRLKKGYYIDISVIEVIFEYGCMSIVCFSITGYHGCAFGTK